MVDKAILFSAFNTHTVFINVIKSRNLSNLQLEISGIYNRQKVDPREVKGNALFTPHVTIAYRDIKPEIFPQMWDFYKNKKFKQAVKIDRFTLLKHDGKNWNRYKEFILRESHLHPTQF